MISAVLAEAAAPAGRVAVQPSLLIFGAVVILIAGFYLGRISDDVHRWWLDLWGTLGFWASRAVFAVGIVAVVWFAIRWYGKHKGTG